MAMSDVWNPAQIEEKIREVSNRIAGSVSECNNTYTVYLHADHNYDVAFAQAYLNTDGPAHAKRYAAELATQTERHNRDVADAAYRYADRRARALQDELRALQSVGASIRSMYAVAGRGEH